MTRSRRAALAFLAAAWATAGTGAGAEAAPAPAPAPALVSGADLVERARELDGSVVAFEGEAIGDLMPRGDRGWVNVSDGSCAVGAWAARSGLERVRRLGSYGMKGDRLRVVGVFHRACAEHGGDLDLHASSIEVVEEGGPIPRPARPGRVAWSVVLLAAAGAAFVLWRRAERSPQPANDRRFTRP